MNSNLKDDSIIIISNIMVKNDNQMTCQFLFVVFPVNDLPVWLLLFLPFFFLFLTFNAMQFLVMILFCFVVFFLEILM